MQLEVLGECGCVLNRELRAWGVRSGWYCWGRLGGATGKVCVWFDWSSIWKWYKFYRFECCLLDVAMKYFIYCNLSRGLWATKKVWGKASGFEFDLRTWGHQLSSSQRRQSTVEAAPMEGTSSAPLEDKWQIVAELRSLLATAGMPMKSRTVNALVEIIDARPDVSVEAIVAVLEELKKIKTYSVLVTRGK